MSNNAENLQRSHQSLPQSALNSLDIERLSSLVQKFSNVTGLATALVDLGNNTLISANFQAACAHFHRAHPDTQQHCQESDTILSKEPDDGASYTLFRCGNGMVDISMPIYVHKEHIANIITGQFFLEKPDLEAYRKRATRLGVEQDAYVKSIADVPVFNQDEVRDKMEFLSDLIRSFGELAMTQQQLMRGKERARRANEDLVLSLTKFYELAPVGFVKVDPETGHILAANTSFLDFTGYKLADMWASQFTDFVARGPVDDDGHDIDIMAQGDTFEPIEVLLTHQNGETLHSLINGVQIKAPSGGFDLWLLVQDVTTLEMLQADLRAQKERAEAANISKSNFLANMSHELRTPLNSIIGFSDLTLHQRLGPVPERYREYAELIHHSGKLLLSHINNILDLSRIEAGKVELYAQPCDLRALTQQVMDMLAVQAEQKNITLRNKVMDGVGVIVDQQLMIDVLMNLVGNALKFTHEGGVTLNCTIKDEHVRLCVCDTGIGMTEEQLQEALQPFAQVHDSPNLRGNGGAGLGLTLAHKVLDLHGGRLIISSHPGDGTKVEIELPKA